MEKLTVYTKKGTRYLAERTSTDAQEIYTELTHILTAKYIRKHNWCKRVARCNLMNGYSIYKCYMDNDTIWEFTIKE